ncbi:hypothetical protein J4E89_000349 [Alternaria sp. Ai002NY15]|nr:hypothetical protein J4E89_000349 [Alternaria sp. Ai002NY15]
MQQSTPSNNESGRTGSHKPIEQCGDLLGEQQEIGARSADICRSSDEPAHPEYFEGANELNTLDTQAGPLSKRNCYLVPRRPLPDLPIDISPYHSSQRTAAQSASSSHVADGISYHALFESSISAREHRVSGSNTQEPTATDPYEPRGHWDDIDDDIRALRRTQPKDANLKYRFGQLPFFGSASPPLISPLRGNYPHSVGNFTNAAPSFHSSTDIQNGPRPPPWGSYEDLEIQRRQRGDARERAKVRAYQATLYFTTTKLNFRTHPSANLHRQLSKPHLTSRLSNSLTASIMSNVKVDEKAKSGRSNTGSKAQQTASGSVAKPAPNSNNRSQVTVTVRELPSASTKTSTKPHDTSTSVAYGFKKTPVKPHIVRALAEAEEKRQREREIEENDRRKRLGLAPWQR